MYDALESLWRRLNVPDDAAGAYSIATVTCRYTQFTYSELHQLTSPNTAYQFLEQALDVTQKVDSSVNEVGLFGQYVWRSWAGIIKSSGVLP